MGKLEEAQNPHLTFAEQASTPSTPSAGLVRAYFKSDGLYYVDDAGTEVGPLSTGGGGSGSTGVLDKVKYDPAAAAIYSASSSTHAELDTTNLRSTFTAPTSGEVIVSLEGFVQTAGGGGADWSLMESGVVVPNTEIRVMSYPPSSAAGVRAHVDILVTGLTPSGSYTYDWAHARLGSATLASTTMGQWAGPGLMTVSAA